MGTYFSREKNEDMLYKKAEVGNKYAKYLTMSLSILSAIILTFFTGGTILLIDGGITLSILIFNLSLSIYEKLIDTYLSYLSSSKKREFKTYLCNFYELTLNPWENEIKSLINNFIEANDIISKTNKKFEENRKYFINESNNLKDRCNILVIGPTGSGKSTLINEFLKLKDNRAIEGIGDSLTMDFKEYRTKNSKYCLVDSQGIDYSKPISEFSKILQSKIKKSNEHPYTFIDMIYYCTNNINRFQTEESKMIRELKQIFNIKRIPLIILFTQCYFEEDFNKIKNYILDKYKEENFTILRIIARKKGGFSAYGLEELKIETEKRLKNFTENAYASKFIANISQKLYKDYTSSYFKSFIKGFYSPNKEESIESLFIQIFNMYRFENRNLVDGDMNVIKKIKQNIINSYSNNLEELTFKIIDFHSESRIKRINEIKKELELSDELIGPKEELKSKLIKNEFEKFKEDIDKIVFPCCLDVLKIEIIKLFNIKVFESLKPKIEELMARK